MPDRPKGMGQTKRDTPVLQRWGFVDQASNLSTVKKMYAQRTSKKPRKDGETHWNKQAPGLYEEKKKKEKKRMSLGNILN